MPSTATIDPVRSLEVARTLIGHEADAVRAVADQLDGSFIAAAQLALDCGGKVFTAGSGTSGMVARRMAHLLSVCGRPAVFLHPMDALHGSSGALAAGDLIIAISKGGESHEINDLCRLAQARDVPVVALTADQHSTLASIANIVVTLTTPSDADPGGVVAMGSTLVTAAWGDALTYVVMHHNGYGWHQVLQAHPAGAVGMMTNGPTVAPTLD